jgi:hypothetical protein
MRGSNRSSASRIKTATTIKMMSPVDIGLPLLGCQKASPRDLGRKRHPVNGS